MMSAVSQMGSATVPSADVEHRVARCRPQAGAAAAKWSVQAEWWLARLRSASLEAVTTVKTPRMPCPALRANRVEVRLVLQALEAAAKMMPVLLPSSVAERVQARSWWTVMLTAVAAERVRARLR